MSEVITAVYSNGVLHPQHPLSLSDGQTVRIQVLTLLGTGERLQENPERLRSGGGSTIGCVSIRALVYPFSMTLGGVLGELAA